MHNVSWHAAFQTSHVNVDDARKEDVHAPLGWQVLLNVRVEVGIALEVHEPRSWKVLREVRVEEGLGDQVGARLRPQAAVDRAARSSCATSCQTADERAGSDHERCR